MVSGKRKGSGYEREVSKFLTNWAGGDAKKEDWYWRVPASGAKFTILESNKIMSGDIIALHPKGVFFTNVFSIECKVGYADAKFENLLKHNKNKVILDFWEQCTRDADKANKYPLVIYKNGPTNWVAISTSFYTEYSKIDDQLEKLDNLVATIKYNDASHNVRFYNFNDFFNSISPQHIKTLGEYGKDN